MFSACCTRSRCNSSESEQQKTSFMEREQPKITLEAWLLYSIRNSMAVIPLWVMRKFSYSLRFLAKQSMLSDKCFRIEEKCEYVERITFNPRNSEIDDNEAEVDIIIFLHGGGFALCDCADLTVSERLLPLLAKKLQGSLKKVPEVFSITYDTHSPSESSGTNLHQVVQGQILRAYDEIMLNSFKGKDGAINSGTNSEKKRQRQRLVAIVGDSAGGNLTLCLAFALQVHHHETIQYRC